MKSPAAQTTYLSFYRQLEHWQCRLKPISMQ